MEREREHPDVASITKMSSRTVHEPRLANRAFPSEHRSAHLFGSEKGDPTETSLKSLC